jgi:hypothetical protein
MYLKTFLLNGGIMVKIIGRLGFFIYIFFVIIALGVSYGAYTNNLDLKGVLTGGSMNYNFDGPGDEFSVEMQNGNEIGLVNLNGVMNYDGKTLRITDMDPIDMAMLEGGNIKFIIKYAIKAQGEGSIRASVDRGIKTSNELEAVKFKLGSKTPYLIINNNDGEGEMEYIPLSDLSISAIDEFLPESLGSFSVSKFLVLNSDGDFLKGLIVLEQTEPYIKGLPHSVSLSSLNLPEEMVENLLSRGDFAITLSGSYTFEIPLDLDQFNLTEVH